MSHSCAGTCRHPRTVKTVGHMSDAAQIEFIKVLPSIILAIVVVGLVIWLRHPLREKLLPRVSGIKLMWFEVTLIQQDVDRSEQAALALTNLISPTADEADQLARWHGFYKAAQEQLVKRAHRIAPVLRGASVLWVDDHPQFNNSQRNI